MKICKDCKKEKPLSEFYSEPSMKSGRRNDCKSCVNIKRKIRLDNNPEAKRIINKRSLDWQKKNRELINKRTRVKNSDPLIKEQNHWKYIFREYGLTKEAFIKLYKEQNNRCKICLKDSDIGELHIDHHHKEGNVRGLLCGTCNRGLGMFYDDINYLKRAIKYLQ